jgi:hypothetical protein
MSVRQIVQQPFDEVRRRCPLLDDVAFDQAAAHVLEDADLRQLAVSNVLSDEPVLYREPIEHGRFAIGGRRKRIVILGILSETTGSDLISVRQRLPDLANVRRDTDALEMGGAR